MSNELLSNQFGKKLQYKDPSNSHTNHPKILEDGQKQNSCAQESGRKCHRVTFKDENEVASEDIDGILRVIYRKLGETIREEDEWDNPFQPDGEVSQDADLILQLWKDGVEITEETLRSLPDEENAEEDMQ